MGHPVITHWHQLVSSGNADGLSDIVAEEAVFHSPVVHRPQVGKDLMVMYLTAAFHVLVNDSFRYVREVIGETEAVLEFTTEIDGIVINGVDMIRWNEDGKIVDFKVMIRPLKAINLLHSLMAQMLQKA